MPREKPVIIVESKRKDRKVKQELVQVVDIDDPVLTLDDEGDEADRIAAAKREVLKAKREIKAELRQEKVQLYDKHKDKAKEKKAKSSKMKKELKDVVDDGKDKEREKK